jgi:hypothetical protein
MNPSRQSPLYRGIVLQHEWTTSADEVLSFDTDSLLANIAIAADVMGGQLVSAAAEHIGEICEQTGNVIDATGRDFYDVIIEAAEQMQLSFDDDGVLQHSILLHPDDAPRTPATPEQEEKLKAIVDRKREEWNAARGRRELP